MAVLLLLACLPPSCVTPPRVVDVTPPPAPPTNDDLARWDKLLEDGKITAEERDDLVQGKAMLDADLPLRGAQRGAIERAVGPLGD